MLVGITSEVSTVKLFADEEAIETFGRRFPAGAVVRTVKLFADEEAIETSMSRKP